MINKFKLTIPVLYLVFNRLDSVKKTFPEIQKAKPLRLFIACDGPRTKKEKKKTDGVRKYILENVNWDCKVKTLFRDKNLGCKYAVAGAIDWFFENVEEGIILEDDCLPNQSFFRFCQEMLERYRNSSKIVHISGSNLIGRSALNKSYLFSRYGAIWGWATWRRTWKYYDLEFKHVKRFGEIKFREEFRFFDKILKWNFFDLIKNKRFDTWDYQWNLTRSILGGLSIIPTENLIQNIGFGKEATHTKKKFGESAKTRALIFPLRHPHKIKENKKFGDKYYKEKVFPSVVKIFIRRLLMLKK